MVFAGAKTCIKRGSYWRWYMLTRPKQWEEFTDEDHDFWVRWGLPIKWTGAAKDFEQGRGIKALVVLAVTPFVLPYFLPQHR